MRLMVKGAAFAVTVALSSCAPVRNYPQKPIVRSVTIGASTGRKADYSFPIKQQRHFSYAITFASPAPGNSWLPAIWLALYSKKGPIAYEFMLFQNDEKRINPEIRIINHETNLQISTTDFHANYAGDKDLHVDLSISGDIVSAAINGKTIDSRVLSFPISHLNIGASTGQFVIKTTDPKMPMPNN